MVTNYFYVHMQPKLSAIFVAEGAFLAISPFEAIFQSDKRYPHKINKFVVEGNLQITVYV